MAVRNPLVLVSGEIQELPSGDTLNTPGGSDPWTKLKLINDLTESSSLSTTIFSFTGQPNTDYIVWGDLIGSGDSSNLGVNMGVTVPLMGKVSFIFHGPLTDRGIVSGNTSDSSMSTNTGFWLSGGMSAILTVRANISLGAMGGTISLLFRKAGSGTFRIFAKSFIQYRIN